MTFKKSGINQVTKIYTCYNTLDQNRDSHPCKDVQDFGFNENLSVLRLRGALRRGMKGGEERRSFGRMEMMCIVVQWCYSSCHPLKWSCECMMTLFQNMQTLSLRFSNNEEWQKRMSCSFSFGIFFLSGEWKSISSRISLASVNHATIFSFTPQLHVFNGFQLNF